MAKLTTLPARVALLSADIASPLPTALAYSDSRRASAHARGYGWAWRKLRARILQRDKYQCQACARAGRLTAATQVDHIVPKTEWARVHGSLEGVDDPAQLQSLCAPCHAAKTQLEAQSGRAG